MKTLQDDTTALISIYTLIAIAAVSAYWYLDPIISGVLG